MSISYYEDGDSIIMEGEPCPSCSSTATSKEAGYGYWKCEDCSTVWGHDEDDPDYAEVDSHSWLLSDPPTEEEPAVCPLCSGGGYVEELLSTCPDCQGDGYLPD